ncbi:baculoviral IAP repeat-containing protein 7-like [Clavelina lepadiformis]|uniref:baculoviral IAP repeat-containing protein 7-like n=1 Tax=Clavelina lepadiformis TaxID=159417 RepID=UPI00404243D2
MSDLLNKEQFHQYKSSLGKQRGAVVSLSRHKYHFIVCLLFAMHVGNNLNLPQSKSSIHRLKNVESDGRIVSNARDPPGQHSIYIPPGDICAEIYRLSTFVRYPTSAQANPSMLAAAGFYFTGYKDRTKCFSCGSTVQDWESRDDPRNPGWHKSDCLHARGSDGTNIPLHAGRSSFPFANDPNRAGPSHQQHRSHTNNPSTSNTFSNTPTTSQRERNTPEDSEEENLMTLFSCSNPVNPHMRSESARINTFLDHLSSWPAHRIRTSIQQIVKAGFFYLGDRDRVKCWYCNGGLQNWERDDDAWREHAKWFPLCEFVLQRKGPEYVHNIVAYYPNLRRPNIPNAPSSVPGLHNNTNIFNSAANRRQNTAPPIFDFREEQERVDRMVTEAMNNLAQVQTAREMGFQDDFIKRTLTMQFNEHRRFFSNSEDLIGALLSLPEQPTTPTTPNRTELAPNSTTEGATGDAREFRRLKEEKLCKKCRQEEARVLLIPCGHLVCCEGCARNIKTCPVCKISVRDTLRTFMA